MRAAGGDGLDRLQDLPRRRALVDDPVDARDGAASARTASAYAE